MKKKYINIILLVLGLTLGFVVITQFKTSSRILESDVVSKEKVESLENEIEKVELDKKALKSKIDALADDVHNYEEILTKNEEVFNELNSQINNLKIASGGYDVKGNGIIIKINDPTEPSEDFYGSYNIVSNYSFVLSIISNLNSAGAEAISVNDQRYTSYTEIVPVGEYLNINGKHIVPPIEIKAIGEQRNLDSAVNMLGGILEQMKFYGFGIEVIESDEIVINGLTKLKEFKYAEPYDAEKAE